MSSSGIDLGAISQWVTKPLFSITSWKFIPLKLLPQFPGANHPDSIWPCRSFQYRFLKILFVFSEGMTYQIDEGDGLSRGKCIIQVNKYHCHKLVCRKDGLGNSKQGFILNLIAKTFECLNCRIFVSYCHYSDVEWAPQRLKSLATQFVVKQLIPDNECEYTPLLALKERNLHKLCPCHGVII